MKDKKLDFEFRCKNSGKELFIEGFANRSMKDGGKVIDRGMEHIPAGEWSVEEWKKNPVIFFNHDRNMPIGQGVGVKVSDDGLWIKAKISNSKDPDISRIRDLIAEGILKTFSVGIDVEDEEMAEDKSITLKGVNLLETSVVTIPMNQESFFSVSQKMLQEESTDQIAAKILKAKGALVAAAIHGRMYEMQSQESDFNRADALMAIAGGADISQGELMEMLAGNTAMFTEGVLGAVATVLGMDEQELIELNDADLSLADADASLNPDDELEEEEEDKEQEEQTEEDEELSSDEEEEEEKAETFPEDEEEKQAEQGVATDSPDNAEMDDPELPKVGEVDDKPSVRDAVEDEQPVSGASSKEEGKEGEEDNAFQACVSEKVRKLLEEGKSQDQALAIAISACEGSKSCENQELSAEDWQSLFADIAAWKQEKEAEKEKADGDDSNGPTAPLNTTEQMDIDLGQPGIAAAQQTNVLLGQLIAEMQKNNKLLSEFMNMKVTDAAAKDEEELQEDSATEEDEELQDDGLSDKELDTVADYHEKLSKRLSRFNV
jgi:HK97 family phage prohead protease